MTTLKEMIEKKFEFDAAKCLNEWQCQSQETDNFFGFGTGEIFDKGAIWQHDKLKAEILPILLECVEALEHVSHAYGCTFMAGKCNCRKQALERLRKWSEK